MSSPPRTYAIIGGGPSGIALGKCFTQSGIDVEILERYDDFGGNWYFSKEGARVYASTHLISSKLNTQFSDHPMPAHYASYPSHKLFLAYLRDVARHYGLYERTRFGANVVRVTPEGEAWSVSVEGGGTRVYGGVFVANGLQRKPRMASIPGTFDGTQCHSASYRTPAPFAGQRVLVIGGGNSGCDIAVDLVPAAARVVHSARRAYHYMPKFIAGKPTQEWLMSLPARFADPALLRSHVVETLKLCGYDPTDYGLPKPEHEIDEAHPILNAQILFAIGHGDVTPKPDVASFDGSTVEFVDGSREEIDAIIHATGYDVEFPFLDASLVDWAGRYPDAFLRAFHRRFPNLFFMGLVNAAGGFGNVANAYGRLFSAYLRGYENRTPAWGQFCRIKRGPDPDLGEGRFIRSERHAAEVDLWKLIKALQFFEAKLNPAGSTGTAGAG